MRKKMAKEKNYNLLSKDEAKELLNAETFTRVTISFYRYFNITDPKLFRDNMYKEFFTLGVRGRIYVAVEGINAQISIPEDNLEQFKTYLNGISGLENLRLNIAVEDDGKSFAILKIKVRNKVVQDGITDPTFNVNKIGKYLNAKEFNQIYNDPNSIIIDMRNHYEYEVGHFSNAIEIPSETFREQLHMAVDMLQDQKDKNIVMYCTGGIRCEKASAWMLHNGFKNVRHLEGGIINYANNVKKEQLENKFLGKNFVFDERLGERVGGEIISKCHQCGEASDLHTNCANDGCHLLFIQCEKCAATFENCCSTECVEVIHLPETKQKELRRGLNNGQKIFNKSKMHKLEYVSVNK